MIPNPMVRVFLRLAVSIVIAIFVFDVVRAQDIDDSTLDVIKESIQVCNTEYNPLQKRMSRYTTKAHKKRSLEIQFVNRLESANEKSLNQVREEMQELSDRLEMLKRVEDVLSDMDPDAVEIAIAEGKQNQDKVMDSLKGNTEPLRVEMNNLHQEYAHKNQELADAFKTLLKPGGTGPLDGFKLKFVNANFASATLSCSYETGVEDSHLNVTVQLKSLVELPAREYEKLDDDFIIYQWTETNLILFSNDIQIAAYDPGRKLGKQKLLDSVKQLIDLNGLAAID